MGTGETKTKEPTAVWRTAWAGEAVKERPIFEVSASAADPSRGGLIGLFDRLRKELERGQRRVSGSDVAVGTASASTWTKGWVAAWILAR